MKELPEQISPEMLDQILEANIYTYRLTDGSYIVAEEINIEFDDDEEYDSNVVYVTMPAQIIFTKHGYAITPWNIISIHDLTELNVDNIVSRSEAPINLKAYYAKFMLIQNIKENLEEQLMEKLFTDDTIDKQDFNEHNRRWEWKPENN